MMIEIGGKKFFVPEFPAEFFIKPIAERLGFPFSRRRSLLRRLHICSESFYGGGEEDSLPELWIGRTGGKIYGDSGGEVLEYASPECDTLSGVVRAERGGDLLLHLLNSSFFPEGYECEGVSMERVLLLKSGSDLAHGGSVYETHFYGSHENYEIPWPFDTRSVSSTDYYQKFMGSTLVQPLASILAARQLLAGAGGLSFDPVNGWRYLIAPRALITKRLFGTTVIGHEKPLISFKNEDECLRGRVRLQLPTESTMMPRVLSYRFAIVVAFLEAFEAHAGRLTRAPLLEDPIMALHEFAVDPTLRATAPLAEGRGEWTMQELLQEWLEILCGFCEDRRREVDGEIAATVREARDLVAESRENPGALFSKTDWGLKYRLLSLYCRRAGIGFSHPKARRFDVQYLDISPRGIYHRWAKRHGDNAFSAASLRDALWEHRAAPRAELRKRLISSTARVGKVLPFVKWGIFPLGRNGTVSVPDVQTADHPLLAAKIRRLEAEADKRVRGR